MSKLKIAIIGFLIFFIYFFLFLFSWGWIIAICLVIFMVILLFFPKNNSIIVSINNWKQNLIKARQEERKIADDLIKYMSKKEQEMLFNKTYQEVKPKGIKHIAVGMSGGVDSSVSAYLLKKQGHKVIGFFMVNWDSVANNELNNLLFEEVCPQTNDYNDAKKVADQLGIELIKVDFIKEYWDYVFAVFLKDIEQGITPNPDILCNRHIKFEKFLEYIFLNYPQIDYVATGHYAKLVTRKNKLFLVEAKDAFKDQTYFLSEVKRENFNKVLFPLSNLTKDEVRKIAHEAKIVTASKKDSTGICFIGERNFQKFLQNYFKKTPGDILDFKTNKKVGEHNGAIFYTIGQRRGLNLGGFEKPYFVIKKDIKNNIIYVSNDDRDSILYTNKIVATNFNQLGSDFMMEGNIEIKTRHSEVKYDGKITNYKIDKETKNITIEVESAQKIKAVTPGQELVLYKHGICLGGGKIK